MKTIASFIALMLMTCAQAWAGHVMVDGSLTQNDFDDIYPGTVHTYQVYVPEQYDGSKPACLYVGLDGVLCNAPAVMDSLIAAGKMPVTIGVFLQPGVIKDKDGNVLRYNRSNEFDMTDGTFAHFLEKDLLPKVETEKTPDGRKIKLSKDANDRMIFGLSSGGICAFNAAWHRPDMFSRVFSGVGTFVSMRGGHDLQAIVRKHEPLPLRIYLQDGDQDVWNALFGHWYEGNKMLASALDFAGYKAGYDWSHCKHGVSQATKIFSRVMEWMWHDYPARIEPGRTQNDLLAPLLPEDKSSWVETTCPRKVRRPGIIPSHTMILDTYPDGSFHVSREENSNWLLQTITSPMPCSQQRFYWLHSYDNSLLQVPYAMFDSQGNLYAVTNAGIQICDQNGRVRGILALPRELDIQAVSGFEIRSGSITLKTPSGRAWVRRLNIEPPTPGVRPKSQGQG